jgi:hypothetical protein
MLLCSAGYPAIYRFIHRPGAWASGRRQLVLLIAVCSSSAHQLLDLLSVQVQPRLRQLFPPPSDMLCPNHWRLEQAPTSPRSIGSPSAARPRAVPAREAHAETPGAARPVRGMQDLGADMHPGLAAALGDQALSRFRSPQGEAGWTYPPVPCSPHTSVSAAAGIARSFLAQVYRVRAQRSAPGYAPGSAPALCACLMPLPPARPRHRSGCRSAIRSAARQAAHSALPCRSPATAGSRVRPLVPREPPGQRCRPG